MSTLIGPLKVDSSFWLILIFCIGAAGGSSLIAFDVVEVWILGVGYGGLALIGLSLVRYSSKE